jgi:hypothetical protein
VENPDRVACIAGIYPVCNLSSYPGIDKASRAYSLSAEELAENLSEHNPIDRIKPLADARIPLYHIHGDSDKVVPLMENSGKLAKRYTALGGKMILNIVKGQGHNHWIGWFQDQDLVDFIVFHLGKDQENKIKTENP